MIPPVSDPGWLKLVTGQKQIRSSNLSYNMLMFNIQLRYKNDPSPANVPKLIAQAREFFVKYEGLLKSEIASLPA